MKLDSPLLARTAGVGHGFFTREGGVSAGLYATLNGGLGSGDDPEAVMENRARVAFVLGVPPAHLITAYQVHSADVAVVETPWTPDDRPRVDAMVTARPRIALAVLTADCGPVLFADAEAGVIGAAHAGWKGALGGVLEATLAAMESLGARRERIAAALGPMIRQPRYEVGAEFVARFTAADPDYAGFFGPAERPGHARFDLAGFIRARLMAAGVGDIDDLGLCTYADEERFFSYRRSVHRQEPDYGRLISAIALSNHG
ncbi:MAG: peptidoglycan editing factor PgeF [Xanthobacteraceae bacterium]|nr:MAG: peptidoglycan editing factor PgeF [Xanthobacteraceae bacterium]